MAAALIFLMRKAEVLNSNRCFLVNILLKHEELLLTKEDTIISLNTYQVSNCVLSERPSSSLTKLRGRTYNDSPPSLLRNFLIEQDYGEDLSSLVSLNYSVLNYFFFLQNWIIKTSVLPKKLFGDRWQVESRFYCCYFSGKQ